MKETMTAQKNLLVLSRIKTGCDDKKSVTSAKSAMVGKFNQED